MKIGIEENVGLKKISAPQYSIMSTVKYPADVTMNYAFGMDISDALSNFQHLKQSELPLNNAQERKHTRCSISAIDGFTSFRHRARVPFSIYGVTRNNCDIDSFL